MRIGACEFGVGAKLIVATATFAALTLGVWALGDERVELMARNR